MTVTMTMAEYENLKQKAEDYEDLTLIAQSLLQKSNAHTVKNDCYNFVRWLENGDIDAMVGQFGIVERDA